MFLYFSQLQVWASVPETFSSGGIGITSSERCTTSLVLFVSGSVLLPLFVLVYNFKCCLLCLVLLRFPPSNIDWFDTELSVKLNLREKRLGLYRN